MKELNASNVEEVLVKCLFTDDEDTSNPVIARGIVQTYGFHPGRLEEEKQGIIEMLSQLPDQFMMDVPGGGGGWSFLQACQNKDGNQWADLHATMEKLVVLGIAVRRVKFLMPREMWAMFPGGMPYFAVFNTDLRDDQPMAEAASFEAAQPAE